MADEAGINRRLTCVLLIVDRIVVRSLQVLGGRYHKFVLDFSQKFLAGDFPRRAQPCCLLYPAQVRCMVMIEAAQATYVGAVRQLARMAMSEAHLRVRLTAGVPKGGQEGTEFV